MYISHLSLSREIKYEIFSGTCAHSVHSGGLAPCISHETEILHFLFEILDRLIFEEFYPKVLSILNEQIIIWIMIKCLQNTKGAMC